MGLIIEIAFLIALGIIIIINLYLLKLRKELKQIENESNLSGMEIARIVSSKYCEKEPHIIKKDGLFLDHYNINRNVIKLSPEVFDGTNMYSSIIAIIIAMEKNNEKKARENYYIALIMPVAYILIILGAFLNNFSIINLGLIIFILTFILSLTVNTTPNKNDGILKIIKKEKIIEPFDSNNIERNMVLLRVLVLARLPYEFINYFR
ncbi:MAG: zinc metallopeptidase [Bacilli bacterium]|jgi:Zn-dependent membrane protease YugP|nr:zinc metallopeptidase [Bacilli bacterium]MCX4253692.1 zinc metallopeptidase [Bacilli bacterium]